MIPWLTGADMSPDTAKRRQVVVDGSNLATEGRTTPSLAQLDEAIRTFLEEYPGFESADVIVVVDATFGHRIDPLEQAAFEQAVEHGEMLTPPAGAIGRGDGFILRIAEKSGAVVLSNDSFQEFHAERPWLFDPGRLIGGKPVPGVGWVFTPRTPVRGPRSRSVTARSARDAESAMSDGRRPPALEAVATGGRSRRARGTTTSRSVGTDNGATTAVQREQATASDGLAQTATKATKTTKAAKVAKAAKAPKATKVTKAAKATKATKTARGVKAATAEKTATAGRSARAAKQAPVPATAKRARGVKAAQSNEIAKPARAATKAAGPVKAAKATKAAKAGSPGRSRPSAAGGNDAMTFLSFVADHPVGSTLRGTVAAFTSHGAHIDVDGMQCHVPLRGLGDPPPQRARQVLSKGETRTFRLLSLEPSRRRAELELAD